jgi:hypothetical protein
MGILRPAEFGENLALHVPGLFTLRPPQLLHEGTTDRPDTAIGQDLHGNNILPT